MKELASNIDDSSRVCLDQNQFSDIYPCFGVRFGPRKQTNQSRTRKSERKRGVWVRLLRRSHYILHAEYSADAQCCGVQQSRVNLWESFFPRIFNSLINDLYKDLKLEKWDKTIDDCNQVLRLERDNLKALLRRGTAFFKKKVYNLAREDMEKCLSIDPNDKKAKVGVHEMIWFYKCFFKTSIFNQEQLAEIDKKDEMDRKEREKVKSMGGNRVQIEDTDGSENEEDYEEKPIKIDMAETTSQTITPVNIAQVESDDDSDQSDESPKSPVKFQLDPKLVEKTDKANQVYKNGQYGEAITHYTNLINELAEISKSGN